MNKAVAPPALDYAAWEILPVMALRVVQAHARVLAIKFL
jgi:hypothetical protein